MQVGWVLSVAVGVLSTIVSGMASWLFQRVLGQRRDRRALRTQIVTMCARYERLGLHAANGNASECSGENAGELAASIMSKEGRDAFEGRDYGRLCALATSVKVDLLALDREGEDHRTVGSALASHARAARYVLGDRRELLDGRPLKYAVSWHAHARKYAAIAACGAFMTLLASGLVAVVSYALALIVAPVLFVASVLWISREVPFRPEPIRARLVAKRRNTIASDIITWSAVAVLATSAVFTIPRHVDAMRPYVSSEWIVLYEVSWAIVGGLVAGMAMVWGIRSVRRAADLKSGIAYVDTMHVDGVCRRAVEYPDIEGLEGCGCMGLECVARRYRL